MNKKGNKKVLRDKVKEYCIELMGKSKTQSLIRSLRWGQTVVISGPHGATGKSTLCAILRVLGYTNVFEEWEINTIQVDKPLTELREKRCIFESLGIPWKR